MADDFNILDTGSSLVHSLTLEAARAAVGAPTIEWNIGLARWRFDPDSDEAITWGGIAVPSLWATFDIKVWCESLGTAGDAIVLGEFSWLQDGVNKDAIGNGVATTVSIPSTNREITVATLQSGVTNNSDQLLFTRLYRDADNASDGLTTDLSVMGFTLHKAS